ncbi:glutamate dehydrogenase/leucine dehydrogenase [Rhizobium paknamense]|uniref:Glutamate dehydrogenase/leucine dehydrogenase n=1 Tax=Rhizobium paknamense TaxID=1206817 RepID=A0ABU0IJU2_9HYPH|nr:glutamate dehydrogenase/leucine dehydrogenase [Rhizobium paknamense]
MELIGLPTSRRALLGVGVAGLAAATVGFPARAARIATKARIVIIGAGAAGTALANHLVSRLDGARITIVDARAEHLYQPGLSLVGCGFEAC